MFVIVKWSVLNDYKLALVLTFIVGLKMSKANEKNICDYLWHLDANATPTDGLTPQNKSPLAAHLVYQQFQKNNPK